MQAGIPLRGKVTRVHATRIDGFFWPASLEGRSSSPDMYAVTFDDGHKAELPREYIIGTGFQSISDVHLKQGQRVLCSVGGREFEADVLEYSLAQQHALVSLNDGTEVVVQPSDLRLPQHHRRSSLDDGYASASPDTLSLSGLSPKLEKRLEDARNAKTEREAESILDECTAALVLTSLSSSPTSWDGAGLSRTPDSPIWKGKRQPPPASPLAFAAAAASRAGRHPSPSPSSTPPPDHDLSASGDETIGPHSPHLTPCRDSRSFSPALVTESPKYHFNFPSPTASSCEPSAWNMAALSSPLLKTEFTYKSQPITIPHSGSRTHPYADHERAFTPPRTDAPQHYRQGSDQDRFVVRGRPQPFVVSSPTRKIKTDGRKCRKVYGMENKHLWCTQCKWKKACTRFTD